MNRQMKTIGVVALQGDFIEHIRVLNSLGVDGREVRTTDDLSGLDGLIIPGGESTTIGKLMAQYNLIKPIQQFIASGKPVWGTCAGAILIADHIYNTKEDFVTGHSELVSESHKKNSYQWIGGMDLHVVRNAFGRQVDSFEQEIKIKGIANSSELFPAVFIRAPVIHKVGENVQILSRLSDDTIVAARQANLLATSFHPELTNDTRIHEYFLNFSFR